MAIHTLGIKATGSDAGGSSLLKRLGSGLDSITHKASKSDSALSKVVKGVAKLGKLSAIGGAIGIAGLGVGLVELTRKALETADSFNELNAKAGGALIGTPLHSLANYGQAVKDLGRSLVNTFGPAIHSVLGFLSSFVGAIRKVTSEGGALYPLLQKFAAVISVVGDALTSVTPKAIEAGASFLNKFGNKVLDTAWKAIEWGAKISVNLAAGIVKGASAALTAAMNFIGKLLSGWLAPGSPPRVAPDLPAWGASAINEWLRGMGSADFDILEGIQGPLRSALSTLADLGSIGADTVGPVFAELSADVGKAIEQFRKTGSVGSAIFEKLKQKGGQFGGALAELLSRQLGVASAVKAVQDAEDRLARARAGVEKHTKERSRLAREYNKLLKEGASPAVLKAKLAELKASESSLEKSEDEVDAAEKQRTAAEKQLELMREQQSIQERLLQQLIEMQRARLMPSEGGAGGGAGGGDLCTLPVPELPTIKLSEKFEELKNSIKDKFTGLWTELSQIWKDSAAGQAIDDLSTKWNAFKTDTLQPLWDKLEPFRTFLGENLKPVLTGLGIAILVSVVPAFAAWALATVIAIAPIVALGAAIAVLGVLWAKYGDRIKETAKQIGFIVTFYFDKVKTWITDFVDNGLAGWETAWDNIKIAVELVGDKLSGIGPFIDTLKTKFDDLKSQTLDKVKTAFDDIKSAIENVITWVGNLISKLADFIIPDWLQGHSPPPLANWFSDIADSMGDVSKQNVKFDDMPSMRSLMGAGSAARPNGGVVLHIENHYGKDSIRSSADVMNMANEQARAINLRLGARGVAA